MKEKYDIHSESESEDDWQSVHKRDVLCCRALGSSTDSDLLVDRHKKSRHNRDKELPVICPGNYHFWKALDYGIYHFVDKSSYYDDEAAQSVARSPQGLQVSLLLNWGVIRKGT